MKIVRNLLLVSSLFMIACAPRGPQQPVAPVEPVKDPLLVDDTPVDENFSIQSTPSGASAKLSSGESCRTPCSVKKKNTDNFDVRIQKEGYKGQVVSVVSTAKVVPGSGASGLPTLEKPRLSPNPARVTLEPEFTRR